MKRALTQSMKLPALSVLFCVSSLTLSTFAEEGPSRPSGEAADAAETEPTAQAQAANAAETESRAQPQAAIVAGAVCVATAAAGIDAADAETVGELVCTELRRRGVSAAMAKTDEGSFVVYRTRLRRLGDLIILELSEEQPDGTITKQARIRLERIEDAVEGAPRVAEALVKGEGIERTATVETLTEQETRQPKLAETKLQFGMGVAAVMASNDVGGGIDMLLGYYGPRWGGGLRNRYAGGAVSQVNLSAEGHIYIGDGQIAPFIGGGIGVGAFGVQSDGEWAPFAQALVGVEVLRFSASRLGLTLNADFPATSVGDGYTPFFGFNGYFLFGR